MEAIFVTPTSPRNYAIAGICHSYERPCVSCDCVGERGNFVALVLAVALGLSGIGVEMLRHL